MRDMSSVIAGILLGVSPAIEDLRRDIIRVGDRSTPVLIEGPTGAGKELVARALHVASGRAGQMVAVNVSALASGIFEALMFGHVRGAYTGAVTGLGGYLEAADRGTLLLDEVNALAAELQPKLLRALETKRFARVGETTETVSDFRIMAATNVPLLELRRTGQVRQDLLFRLTGIVLRVPPLAEHPEDIAMLASHFLATLTDARTVAVAPAALRALERYTWPGNVRELRYVIARADTFASGSTIGRDDIERALAVGECIVAQSYRSDRAIAELRQALEEACGDVAVAAELLGVHRATVYRRMARHGVMFARSGGRGSGPDDGARRIGMR